MFKKIPGFKKIPLDKVGMFVDEYRKEIKRYVHKGYVGAGKKMKKVDGEKYE